MPLVGTFAWGKIKNPKIKGRPIRKDMAERAREPFATPTFITFPAQRISVLPSQFSYHGADIPRNLQKPMMKNHYKQDQTNSNPEQPFFPTDITLRPKTV
jgi:hypothetical protein